MAQYKFDGKQPIVGKDSYVSHLATVYCLAISLVMMAINNLTSEKNF